MKLTHKQKLSMLNDGYIHVPGVIPKIMVDQALKHINHALGEGMPSERMMTFRAQSYCPELQDKSPITGLFNDTPVRSLVEDLIGEGKCPPTRGGQIALRFPTLQDPPVVARPHLDGMYSPHNGVKEGTIGNFTMLVGVLLSPVRDDFAGNFTVWPGTHKIYEQYFRENGPESLLGGIPPVELPEPVQTRGEPGDVFLVHYQLAHSVANNASPFTRYAIFFRVTHPEHGADWKAPMTDIWLHWPGIREIGT
ncbi:phytanoyl-CoA dioxygenase PhyH [Paenibacillus taihuensis]|uniref:Phytanoyl-CoA dioxygenase PhyH n=1 Tax=Paenibacillus taihuensis TaxID=1156355 RepID=A0A3D9QUU1_9BACL|nr:phytanoyl-CoA dioxygenase family protein [Paenibacillus taihuensis]REE67665.1 phytanoyl-CoA dioxygenase PhyH [Paenibacillus taihuensis]